MTVLRDCSVCGSMTTAYCRRCRADICDTECLESHRQLTHARIPTPARYDRVFKRGFERAFHPRTT